MAQISHQMLKSVVAIGVPDAQNTTQWIASGFLYGRRLSLPGHQNMAAFVLYLVSNRHVFEGHDGVVLQFWSADGGESEEVALPFVGEWKKSLYLHPTLDLAAVLIKKRILDDRGLDHAYLEDHVHIASLDMIRKLNLSEGDLCYALGFPMGLVGEHRHRPIVKLGTIARISDFLNEETNDIWIDSDIFPGNSGGPVINKPEAASLKNTNKADRTVVFGIISHSIRRQVRDADGKVINEESTGLAKVVPSSYLVDWISSLPEPPIPISIEKRQGPFPTA